MPDIAPTKRAFNWCKFKLALGLSALSASATGAIYMLTLLGTCGGIPDMRVLYGIIIASALVTFVHFWGYMKVPVEKAIQEATDEMNNGPGNGGSDVAPPVPVPVILKSTTDSAGNMITQPKACPHGSALYSRLKKQMLAAKPMLTLFRFA